MGIVYASPCRGDAPRWGRKGIGGTKTRCGRLAKREEDAFERAAVWTHGGRKRLGADFATGPIDSKPAALKEARDAGAFAGS
jgi:hypothetical protein